MRLRTCLLTVLCSTSAVSQAQTCVIEPGPGAFDGPNIPRIHDMIRFDDGTGEALYVCGRFETVDGITVNNIARWDGDSWTALGDGLSGDPGFSAHTEVYDLEVHDMGSGPVLLAAGAFSESGPDTIYHAAQWDGAMWSQVGDTALLDDSLVGGGYKIFPHDDGTGETLYLAGGFFLFDDGGAAILLRLEGGVWTVFGGGAETGIIGAPGVPDVAVFDAGDGPKLYIASKAWRLPSGELTTFATWDGTGFSTVPAFGQPGSLDAIEVYDDGTGEKMFISGDLSPIFGPGSSGIAVWDGATSQNFATEDPDRPSIQVPTDFEAFDDGTLGPRLYACGRFTTIDGQPSTRLVSWNGSGWDSVGANAPDAKRMYAFDFPTDSSSNLYLFEHEIQRYTCPFQIFEQPRALLTPGLGERVELPVSTVGGIANVEWFRDGQLLTNGDGYSETGTTTLAIDVTSDAFTGLYTCEIEGLSGIVLTTDPIVLGVRPPPCPADLTRDGVVNFFDVSQFLNLFGVPCP